MSVLVFLLFWLVLPPFLMGAVASTVHWLRTR